MIKLIEDKFAPPGWAVFAEVANGTGFARRQVRSADALALSLWPSRGIELHGFEVKMTRSDWLRELKNPKKAEEIAKWCDKWWIVAVPGVVEKVELPPNWGLLESTAKGKKKLVQKMKAEKLKAQPWDRLFMAAILRRAAEQQETKLATYVRKEDIAEHNVKAIENAVAKGEASARTAVQRLKELNARVKEFEKAAGFEIGFYDGQARGEALKAVMELERAERSIEQLAQTTLTRVKAFEKAAKAFIPEEKP